MLLDERNDKRKKARRILFSWVHFKMPSCRVTFVRHGESEWNKQNLFCGWYDARLSEKGEQDAREVSAAALVKENAQFDIAFTSALCRANTSLQLILETMNSVNIPIHSSWRLNERHYGALTGFNKRQMADEYGEEQVQTWRRSYDVPPPPITSENPHYESIRTNPRFRDVPPELFPDSETLASTIERVIPFWTSEIVPLIKSGKRILIVAHGTSLRGIIKHIEGLSKEQIMKFDVPNSIPFTYDFDMETMSVIGSIRFLADEETVLRAMEKTRSIGK